MNENHLRSIKSSLLFVEKKVTDLQDRITREVDQNKLYRYVNDLDDEYRDRTLKRINHILSEIACTAQTLNIEPTEISLRREAESNLMSVWVVLESLKPEIMNGYGTLNDVDRQTLNFIYERFNKALTLES